MTLPDTPPGGATIGHGRPQPKGRPTEPHEVVCPRCSLSPCRCGDPVAELVHDFTYRAGIPLPLSTCHRLAVELDAHYAERTETHP